jgi:hypothetical protein
MIIGRSDFFMVIFQKTINSRRFPLFKEEEDSSCPRKASPCFKRYLEQCKVEVKQI